MQIPAGAVAQPTPNAAPPALPVFGPAAPAAPIEPARRVTANRDGGRGDLQPQLAQRAAQHHLSRGKLLDLLV